MLSWNKANSQTVFLLFLFFSNISYLSYLITLGYFNRLEVDDYCFIKVLNVYWYCGVLFALLGISEMLSNSKKVYSYILLIGAFLYAGSSAENFGIICLLLLSLFIIYRILNSQISLSTKIVLSKEIVAFITCLLAFLIMFFESGNNIRQSFFPV